MKIKTTLFAVFSIFSTSTISFAQLTHKEQVFQTVKNYALATACRTTFEESEQNNYGNPEDTIYITYTTTDHVYLGNNRYFVLWGGFDGCSIAATGENYTYQLTWVEYDENANRFLITMPTIIEGVTGEGFFTLANIDSFKELNDGTFELYLYMFNEHDVDKETGYLKKSAQPGYYRMVITEDVPNEFSNMYKVVEKNRIDITN